REQRGETVGLLIFDSLAAFVPRFTTPQETDETLEALTRLCERFGCALLFIHHFNKTGRTVDSAIGGASAVTRVARSVYLLARQPGSRENIITQLLSLRRPDPDQNDGGSDVLVLACQKLNIAEKPSSLRFTTEAVDIPE